MVKFFCQREGCENEIPAEKIAKSGAKRRQRYCSHRCAMLVIAEQRKQSGWYQRWYQLYGQRGNVRQAEIKAITGVRPGYEKRAEQARRLNRLHLNRKKGNI